MTADLDRVLAQLPRFSSIDPTKIVAELSDLLNNNRQDVTKLIDRDVDVTWGNFIQPLEEIGDRLSQFWSPIGHLHGVADSDALRTAYNEAVAKLSEYSSELAQSDGLAAAFRRLRDSAGFARLSIAQKRVVDNALRDFKLGGIELNEKKRERFRAINQELAKLTTKFSENVLDATQAWTKNIDELTELSGLPESALALARHGATSNGKSGYTLTLDFPCYMPVMSYCDNRELRREMYEAYVTRASEQGPDVGRFDNSKNIDEILALRQELANLLDYENYAQYSLATKMAPTTDSVIEFLENLATHSLPAAQRDQQELSEFAVATVGLDQLEPWDVAYCAEKLQEDAYSFSQEELRPYFPVDRVLAGLFTTVGRLFEISVEAVASVDTWNRDVMVYQIRDNNRRLRGAFYLDIYAREHKRGGAWMDECIVRRVDDGDIQSPVAYLTCNFTPPVDGNQCLLTHNEVLTLFHEFGHGLHHMLTLVDYASVSGINGVPWDGVELPSQFLENWAWERSALDVISGHFESGEPIPNELFERMHAARNFHAGMQMVRQLEFALFDFKIHLNVDPDISVQTILDEVRALVTVLKPYPNNRFQHGFSHIFAGGYAAGYYSYKWAEVLSADAFSRFEDEGVFNPDTGKAFREHILEQGGSEDTMILFERFRGRPPEIEPLLKKAGLAT